MSNFDDKPFGTLIKAIQQYQDTHGAKLEPVTDFASEQRALHSALFLVAALTEFANTKVSVISVHEIPPSFFVLVEKDSFKNIFQKGRKCIFPDIWKKSLFFPEKLRYLKISQECS